MGLLTPTAFPYRDMAFPLWGLRAGGAPAPGCGRSVRLPVSAPGESEEAGEELGPALGTGALLCNPAEAASTGAPSPRKGRRQGGSQYGLRLHCQGQAHLSPPAASPNPSG